MVKLLSLLVKYAGYRVEDKIAAKVAPIGPFVRALSIGVACVALSVGAFIFALLFLAASLFLVLGNQGEWSMAAFWTGLAVLSVGAILLGVGLSFLKTPYHGGSV